MPELNLAAPILYVAVPSGDSISLGPLEFFTDESETTSIDFTGSTWKAQIRTAAAILPSGAAPATFTVDTTQQNLGRLTLTLAGGITEGLASTLLYADLEQILGATRKTWFTIELTVEKQVSL